jgi:hypothetical protein
MEDPDIALLTGLTILPSFELAIPTELGFTFSSPPAISLSFMSVFTFTSLATLPLTGEPADAIEGPAPFLGEVDRRTRKTITNDVRMMSAVPTTDSIMVNLKAQGGRERLDGGCRTFSLEIDGKGEFRMSGAQELRTRW